MPQARAQTESIAFDVWIAEVDEAITSAIEECYERAWVEDVITYRWLQVVTSRFRHVTIADLEAPFTVSWDAYKATSSNEYKYGDIVIIVQFRFTIDGKMVSTTGVGAMEAKRLDRDALTYSHLRWDQLERQAANIAVHRVLLYDFDNIEAAELNVHAQGFCRHAPAAPYQRTHAVTVVTQHVLAAKTKSREVASLGVPLGYQLCTRYLRGFDLEYGLDPAEFLESIPGGPSFLIVASVTDTASPLVVSGEPAPLPVGYQPISEASVDLAFEVEDPFGAEDLLRQFSGNPISRKGFDPEEDAIEEEGEAEMTAE